MLLRGNGSHWFTTPQLYHQQTQLDDLELIDYPGLIPFVRFRDIVPVWWLPKAAGEEAFSGTHGDWKLQYPTKKASCDPIRRKISTEAEPAAPSICEYLRCRSVGLAPLAYWNRKGRNIDPPPPTTTEKNTNRGLLIGIQPTFQRRAKDVQQSVVTHPSTARPCGRRKRDPRFQSGAAQLDMCQQRCLWRMKYWAAG